MMMRSDEAYTPITGCDATEIMNCLLLEGDEYDACIAACSSEEEEEVLPGYATVSAKAAADQTVALNAVDKKIGTVTLKAGENDTTVTNIQITKGGLGDSDGIKNISLVKNDEYATNSASLKNNVATLRFSPALTIKANSSETFDVVVSTTDKAGTVSAGGQYEFSVTSVNVANGTFGGTPAKLGSLTTTNYKVKDGTVNDLVGGTVKAGDEKATIATIEYTPNADAIVNSITLTSIQDELDGAFANAKAYIDDALVGTVSVNNDTIVIKDMDTKVEKGDKLEVVVKADITYVGNLPGFDLFIDENHVNAVEVSTNERMATAGFAVSAPATRVKISGLGVTLKNNGEKTTTTKGAEVTLLDMTVSSAESVDVTSYYVDFGQNKATVLASFDDIVVDIDGSEYDIDNTTIFTTNAVVFSKNSDKFNVSSNNDVKVKVTAKVKGTATSSYTLEFGMTAFKVGSTPIVNTVKKSGHTTTINGKGTLTLTKTTTEGSTIATEAKDILALNLKAKNENVTLNSIKFNLAIDDALTGNIESIELYQGNNQLGDTLDEDDLVFVSAGNYTVSFASLGQLIKADETLPFSLRLKLEKTDSDVIGKVITGSIAAGNVKATGKTSKDATIANTTAITGKGYQVSASKSLVSVTQSGQYIYVTVKNNSDYRMVLSQVNVDVKDNIIDGESVLDKLTDKTVSLYEENAEDDLGITTASKVPGTINVAWANGQKAKATLTLSAAATVSSGTEVTVNGVVWTADSDTTTNTVAVTQKVAAELATKADAAPTEGAGVISLGGKTVSSINITTAGKAATFPVFSDDFTFVIKMNTTTNILNSYYDVISNNVKFYYVDDDYVEGDMPSTSLVTEK